MSLWRVTTVSPMRVTVATEQYFELCEKSHIVFSFFNLFNYSKQHPMNTNAPALRRLRAPKLCTRQAT